MRMIRSFVAIPLPETLTREAAQLGSKLSGELRGISWVKPEAMHLTLRFFGDIPEESLEKIGKVMLSVGSLHAPFHMEVGGLGAFPSASRARVFWLGIEASSALADLHTALEAGFSDIDMPGDGRPFTPHLTLGRNRGRPLPAREILEKYADFSCGSVTVDRIVLFESRLHPTGARHLPVKTVYLEEPRAE
ncbi:RNA 2',3'-cyclic phosphodiesterase [Desulfuromonas versatilis]|uniref:RNA 2',3'-cyclic phosphodiesterase n=1 Tax=Desulfuromonas versatilis TaxID=2802975 RepID=A0ABM8HW27_9BACT|nr:RNA 2',3'-cyclic phosphodiesterase [Desulfuromonas versatilis]BCR06166.1 RNA 2',3'-cyclic phosphodiesterase [Desulfuromonas versatilis]